MKNAWLGYVGSALIVIAGVLMLVAKRYLAGILFLVAGIAGAVLKYNMNQKSKKY